MKRGRRALRKAVRAVAWGVMILAVGLGFIAGALKFADWRALPEVTGTVTAQGLGAPVTIGRDARGIPLITAASDDDAYFALGYVHAQDRLFEMEMMRRQGQGRLAELVGKPGIGPDRFMLTLGIYRRAQADFEGLDAPTRRAFDRYAAGVNAWLGEQHPLPLEFAILQFSPEPWTPADSLVWQKLMGLQLSGNWDEELLQSALVAKLGAENAGALDPNPRPTDAVTISAQAMDGLQPRALLKAMTAVIQPISASNVWTIAGNRTATGKPILANDPHLNFQAPSIWYLVGIDTPTLKVFGATIPGVPLHIVGHNENVAWGLTTTQSDTSDLFVEQMADGGGSYVTPQGAQPFTTRAETIRPRFNTPVPLTVRETRHGPVVSDILQPQPGAEDYGAQNRVLALAATVLAPGDRSAQALYKMARAANADEFAGALENFHAPQQNIMFADTMGGIGYIAAGRVPIRKAGDGTVPVPGWNGDYDWTGWIPFAELPRSINPASGVLVNANNKMVPDDYPYLIAAHWPEAYRANRITEVIAEKPQASVESTVALQQDVVSLMARELLPLAVAHTVGVKDRALLDRLKLWDGSVSAERWEPLVFSVWMERIKRRVFADELGELYPDFGGARPAVLRNVLARDESWCDDKTTPAIETCDQMVSAAWNDTLAWLKDNTPSDPEKIHWSDFHIAAFRHILFGNFPGIGGFGALTIPTPGDTYTVNRGTFLPSTSRAPFRHVHGSSLRAIYDLSDLKASRFALPGGESGQMSSAHYGDLLTDWRDRRYFTAPTDATIVSRQTLNPP